MCKIDDVATLGSVVLTRLISLIADHEKEDPGRWYGYWTPWPEVDERDMRSCERLLGQAIKDVLEEDTTIAR